MKWFHETWFNILCYCLVAVGVLGLFVNGLNAEDMNNFIGLVFGVILAVLAVIGFVKAHIANKKLKALEGK